MQTTTLSLTPARLERIHLLCHYFRDDATWQTIIGPRNVNMQKRRPETVTVDYWTGRRVREMEKRGPSTSEMKAIFAA